MNDYKISVGEKDLEMEEIIDFLSKIFGPNYHDASAIKEAIFDTEPSISPGNFILARSAKRELIGLVRIVERNIIIDREVIAAGFISSVGVKPEWRRQGIASNLIKKAIEVMISRGMDISLVYGRRAVDGFYSRFGYYGIGRYVDLEIISPSPCSKFFIGAIPFKKENLEICMKLYGETYGCLTGSVLREHAVWKFLLAKVEKNIGNFKLSMCLKDDKPIGYFVVSDNKLIEISLPSKLFSSVQHLLHRLNIQLISIHPRHPFYIYCRTSLNTIQKERFALDGGYMGRILNLESLLKKLGLTFASRASVIGVSNKKVGLLNYEIDLRSGKVSKTDKSDDIIFKKKETAVQFLLGVISPHDIVGVKWTTRKPWIPYLFPELHYHTSALDEV